MSKRREKGREEETMKYIAHGTVGIDKEPRPESWLLQRGWMTN